MWSSLAGVLELTSLEMLSQYFETQHLTAELAAHIKASRRLVWFSDGSDRLVTMQKARI
jgi:hypothetical protein